MKLFFKMVRAILGPILLFCERIFKPKALKRSAQDQSKVDLATKNLALYQFQTCPFCLKVRRAIARLGLKIELRDILKNKQFETELIEKGGQRQAPCLRISKNDGTVQWMYESDDIISYLEKLFGAYPTKA